MSSINNHNKQTKPKKQYTKGFKKRADELAIEYRNKLGLKPYQSLSALKVAELLGLNVKTPDQIAGITSNIIEDLLDANGRTIFSAVTLGVEKPSLIIHNHLHSLARQESNIMHECAHVILEHEMCEFDNSYGIVLRKYNDIQENEAEWLGACLQVPKQALIKYFIYQNKSIEEIADLLNASIQMVRYRVGVCGVERIKRSVKLKGMQ